MRLFIGGVRENVVTNATGSLAATTERLLIGRHGLTDHHFHGYLDDLSIPVYKSAIVASIVSNAHNKIIASLIQQLEHTEADVQDSARQSLAEIGESAVPVWIQASGD